MRLNATTGVVNSVWTTSTRPTSNLVPGQMGFNTTLGALETWDGTLWITAAGGAGYGTVTSIGGNGTVSGISLTGLVTSSGNLTLGGVLDLSIPPTIGNIVANTGVFTNVRVINQLFDSSGNTGIEGQILSSTGIGTLWIENAANVNLSSPPPIGNLIPNSAVFTDLTITESLIDGNSNTGHTGQFLSTTSNSVVWDSSANVFNLSYPPPIGNLIANTANFTTMTATNAMIVVGTIRDSTGVLGTNKQILSSTGNGTRWIYPFGANINFASPPPIGNATPNSGFFTTLTAANNLILNGNIVDVTGSLGIPGQLLLSTGNSIKWSPNPAVDLSSPPPIGNITPNTGFFNSVSVEGNIIGIANARANVGDVLTTTGAGVLWTNSGGLGVNSTWYSYGSPDREPGVIYTNNSSGPMVLAVTGRTIRTGPGSIASITISLFGELDFSAGSQSQIQSVNCIAQTIVPIGFSYLVSISNTTELVAWSELRSGSAAPVQGVLKFLQYTVAPTGGGEGVLMAPVLSHNDDYIYVDDKYHNAGFNRNDINIVNVNRGVFGNSTRAASTPDYGYIATSLLLTPSSNTLFLTYNGNIHANTQVAMFRQWSINSSNGNVTLANTYTSPYANINGSTMFGNSLYLTGNLYEDSATANCISIYDFNPTSNTVTFTGYGSAGGGESYPSDITISPDGKFAYVYMNSPDRSISIFSRNLITSQLNYSNNVIESGPQPTWVYPRFGPVITPDGNFLYTWGPVWDRPWTGYPNYWQPAYYNVYSVNKTTGELTQTANIAAGSGNIPYAMCISPDSKYAYTWGTFYNTLGDVLSNMYVVRYDISPTDGLLTFKDTAFANISNEDFYATPKMMDITKDGLYLYTIEGGAFADGAAPNFIRSFGTNEPP